MSNQIIGATEIGWFNPSVTPPPGSRSEDCGRTFEPYTVVLTAYGQTTSPSDEYDDISALDEFEAGARKDFLDFQFDLKDDDDETLDWYSDSIIAWAYYPVGVAQTAFDIEKARQAAAVRP